ncbi:VWA domain-containing protein [Calidifontibacillus erzurumensis]|uniref:VWA domain-containing protein n=1 Tax=Calidifontibacillus erzurumensis TaxID=2741433 RepID=UPI0035B526F0
MYKNNSVLNTDRYDRRRFKEIYEMSNRLKSIHEKGKKDMPFFFPLMGDLWASLYKMKPELLSKDDIDTNLLTNHSILERIMNDDSYKSFHNTTKLDDLTSAIGAVNYSEKVHEWLIQEKQKNEELQKAMEEALKQQEILEQAQQEINNAEKELEQAQSNDKKTKKNAKTKKTKATNKMENAEKSFQQAMQNIANSIASSKNCGLLIQALQDANKQTQDQKKALVDLLGGADNGEAELKKVPLSGQIKLAEKLVNNNKLKLIAEWAGKFKLIAQKKQRVKHTESVDRSGVTLGSEIERLLPIELAQFTHTSTKLDFLQRFTEKQTKMFAQQGKERLGKGPIVLCLDQSGSMTQMDEQSKGFVLALMMIARKQRRDFALVLFSTVTKTLFYEKGKITPNDLLALAETFLGGGTRYTDPLTKAVSIIESEKRFKKADIIFVTDGEPSDIGGIHKYMSVYEKIKKEKEFNCTSILLGYRTSETYVRLFSDKIVRGLNFTDDKVMDSAFTI